jgi:hypothetical protein
MSDFENVHPLEADPAPPPRTFDFFESLLVALIAYAVFLLAGQLTIMLSLPAFMNGLSSEEIDVLRKQQHRQSAAVILATPAAIAVLWVAIRRTGRVFTEYLGSELAKQRRDRICSRRHDDFFNCRSLRNDQTWTNATSIQLRSCRRRRLGTDGVRCGHLRSCSGPRGVRISRIYISRMVSVVPGSDRCDRAYVGAMGDAAQPVRLV